MEQVVVWTSSDNVQWLFWGPEAFARARTKDVPVLLTVAASWCHWCAEMSRTTYCDPAVCDLIADRFVPIWVDSDRRPDVSERYNLGGWPTTAFLSPDGEILGGERYVRPGRMTMLLKRVAEAFARRPDGVSSPGDTPRLPVKKDDASYELPEQYDGDFTGWLERRVVEDFDPVHGGFGLEPKRVHASAVLFALRRGSVGRNELREVATRTLDAIAWGGLYDDVDGGFFSLLRRL